VLLSVSEAARVLGLSRRSIYGYMRSGKLTRVCIEGLSMVREAEVLDFGRAAQVRSHGGEPPWNPPPDEQQSMTTIIVRAIPGCEEKLEQRLERFYRSGMAGMEHTAAQYIGRRAENPGEVVILLLWPGTARPSDEQRALALATLRAELAEVCDWSAWMMDEGKLVLRPEEAAT
jgi:hypothetical protein